MANDITFFEDKAAFRDWLHRHHDREEVLWMGLYKVDSGRESIRWAEAVEVALSFGWIDGLRKSIDEESYKIRFSPRKPGSHWSRKNIDTVEQLIGQDRMHPAGMEAYRSRDADNTARASYEQEQVGLKEEYREQLRANEEAWRFFQELAPGYTRTSVHWVMSAKKEETRRRRLRILIESSAKGEKIPLLRRG